MLGRMYGMKAKALLFSVNRKGGFIKIITVQYYKF